MLDCLYHDTLTNLQSRFVCQITMILPYIWENTIKTEASYTFINPDKTAPEGF